MGDSLPWTPMNRRAKFDAASFILAGEIRNHTKKTVTDISTPCLSASVSKNIYTVVKKRPLIHITVVSTNVDQFL